MSPITMGLNNAQAMAFLRTALQLVFGSLVTRGLMDGDTATALASALATVILIVWGVWARRNVALVASAATVPSVVAILTDAATASAVPSDKVQPERSGGIVAAPAA